MIEIKYLTENSCSIVENNNYKGVQNSIEGRQEILNLPENFQQQVLGIWGDIPTVEDIVVEIPIIKMQPTLEERILQLEVAEVNRKSNEIEKQIMGGI